jgi:uncharacterized integral membrane protein (TIGR00698 family)
MKESFRPTPAHLILPLAALVSLTPWISSGIALLTGTLLALTLGNPFLPVAKKMTHRLLALSVMGLGAGMNLGVIGRVGFHGIGYTVCGILIAVLLGSLLGRVLRIEKDTSLLITVGTAICGGSAIAAVAPVIRAKHQEVSVALGTVFLLNAAALFIFPWIGHRLDLSQSQFGLWSALAIHDTSSVVGATLQYGTQALEVGTTVKLARALWIVPVAMVIGFMRARQDQAKTQELGKAKRPWFILGFIIMAALVTWVPSLQPLGHQVESAAKKMMVLTLFLIGSSLTRETIKSVGIKPFVQGIILWLIMASGSLSVIYEGIIH